MKKLKLKKGPKIILIILIVLSCVLILLGGVSLYFSSPVDRGSKADIEVVIKSGTSTKEIASLLRKKHLIKSDYYFMLYVKIHKIDSLKASTYTLSPSMNLREIVSVLSDGNSYNENVVNITFKEGVSINKYALEIAKYTSHSYDEVIAVMNDKVYLNELINKYWFLTNEILNESIYYPLEGYLMPNTYQFSHKDVSIKEIIEVMLNQTDKELTKYKSLMTSSVHSYITMASIIELEGTNTQNRKMITQVFNNRLSRGMNLGSDVTTYYALQKEMKSDLTSQEFATINQYNTRASNMGGKLPVGPICNPGITSIEAAISPTPNDYLFFVADKNGKIYYSKTIDEHNKLVKEIKDRGDWIW